MPPSRQVCLSTRKPIMSVFANMKAYRGASVSAISVLNRKAKILLWPDKLQTSTERYWKQSIGSKKEPVRGHLAGSVFIDDKE